MAYRKRYSKSYSSYKKRPKKNGYRRRNSYRSYR